MRVLLAILIGIHGMIHLTGFGAAFGFAQLKQRVQPIARPIGVGWLLAASGYVASGVLLIVAPRSWWIAALPALLISQWVILSSWTDAKFGTIANLIILVPLALSLLDLRSSSFRSMYEREADRGRTRPSATAAISEGDLTPLPAPVQKYLRRAGVVGKPHVVNFRARFRGEMRSEPSAKWMKVEAEQYDFFDPLARIFLIRGARFGVPFEGLHLYVGPTATMQVRVLSLFDVVDARGPEMNRSETVTLFNDLCILAPAALVDADVEWQERDALTVIATFTNAGNTITAELVFDEEGDLVDFVSRDRFKSADGRRYENFPWSTPLSDYRDFGGARLAARGDATWREPAGDFTYARFELVQIEYNVERR